MIDHLNELEDDYLRRCRKYREKPQMKQYGNTYGYDFLGEHAEKLEAREEAEVI